MATVEELRERLIQAIGTYGVAEDKGMPSELCETLDSLIAAAREEGAKQERERIVCGSQRFPKGEYVVDSDYISMVFSPDGIGEAMTDCELFIIPASLLAPDKESEK